MYNDKSMRECKTVVNEYIPTWHDIKSVVGGPQPSSPENVVPHESNIILYTGLISEQIIVIINEIEEQKIAINSLEAALSKILTPEETYYKINEKIFNQIKDCPTVEVSLNNSSIQQQLSSAYLRLKSSTKFIKTIIDRIEL